jgi:protein-tyrosine-phosphatase
MVQPDRNILFLCTRNSARSIMAEAIANKFGKPHLRAFSAGSHPGSSVNPNALELLMDLGYETLQLRSKSWTEFTGPRAPKLDIVITLCDDAADETCPVWPGAPVSAHWGMADPALAKGRRTRAAFIEAYELLEMRIGALTELPMQNLDAQELRRLLRAIGTYGAMAAMTL